jgi:hypothetical protein
MGLLDTIRKRFAPKEPIKVHLWKTKDGTEIPVHEMTDEHLTNAYKMSARRSIDNAIHAMTTNFIGVPSYIVQDYETEWDHWAGWCRILGDELRRRKLMTDEIKTFVEENEERAWKAQEQLKSCPC